MSAISRLFYEAVLTALFGTTAILPVAASEVVYQILPVTLTDDDGNKHVVTGSMTTDGSSFSVGFGQLSAVVDYQIDVVGPIPYVFSPSNAGSRIYVERAGDGGGKLEFEATSSELMLHFFKTCLHCPDQLFLILESDDAMIGFGFGWGPPSRVSYLNHDEPTLAWAEVTDDRTMVVAAIPQTGDCLFDGHLDAKDLECIATIEERDAVLASLGSLPGDLDGNGDVSFRDFLILSHNFGLELASYADGNIDLVPGVDFDDFVILSDNFGYERASTLATVPEAAFHLFMWLALFSVALRRRSRRGTSVN